MQRYEFIIDKNHTFAGTPDPDGMWVRYDDHYAEVEALTRVIIELRQENERLRSMVTQFKAAQDSANEHYAKMRENISGSVK